MARAAAAQGHPALRFDVRGMGDAEGEPRSFEQLVADIGSAIDTMFAAEPGLRGVVLCGLCDGASAILLYLAARPDPRVAGLCLLNPWVRSVQSQAQTRVQHYYRQRLLQPAFWRKLLSGGVALRALRELAQSLRLARRRPAAAGGGGFQQRMLAGWQGFHGPSLLVLSGDDYTAKEFLAFTAARDDWQRRLADAAIQVVELAGADHTFSTPASHDQLEAAMLPWLLTVGEVHR
jgi:exosortase A-associated hydrolase 1